MDLRKRALEIFEAIEETERWWRHAQETASIAADLTKAANSKHRYKRDVHARHLRPV